MKLFKSLSACAAALMLLLCLPAAALEAPEKAIGKDTTMLVWFDVSQVDDKLMQKYEDLVKKMVAEPALQQNALPQDIEEINKVIEKVKAFRKDFVNAGGSGLMMSVAMPGENEVEPKMSMLAKSDGAIDGQAMSTLLKEASEEDVDAQVVAIGGGWHDVSIVSKEGDALTSALPAADAAALAAFKKQLDTQGQPLFAMVFRMQDSMRQMMDFDPNQLGPDAQQDPTQAMMMGMLGPIKALDTVGMAMSYKQEKLQLDIQMNFLNAESATQFLGLYNTIIMTAPAMLAMQFQGAEGAPDPNQLNELFMKLQMKGEGDTLKLSLDQEFFDMAEKLGETMKNFFEAQQGVAPDQNAF